MRALLLISLLAGSAVGGAAAQDARPAIAVLPFDNSGSYGKDKDEFEALRKGIAGILTAEFGRNAGLRATPREDAQRALDGVGLGAGQAIDAQTAARLGRQLGVRYLVTGTFIDLYGDFRIDARIVDLGANETVTLVRSDPKLSDRQQLHRIIQSVADRIVETAKVAPTPASTRNVPTAALVLYSRGLLHQDRGDRAKASELLTAAVRAAADFTEAQEALRRLGGS